MAKKLHWTQTPEGRKLARKNLLRASKLKYARRKEHLQNGKSQEIPDSVTAYAFGHVSAWLEVYANSTGYARGDVTHRVATLLLRQARG